MAEKDGASKSTVPRPTITLPGRSSVESFFRGTDSSPGPMTLVSSFFSEHDPDSECRSFSQLLAGAIASPNAISGRKFSLSGSNSGEDCTGDRGTAEGGGDGGFRFKQNRPLGLAIAQSPFFTIPPGFSPTSLLESPNLFSSGQGQFEISHQQALAQVTAQAVQSQTQIHIQTEYPTSLSEVTTTLTHPTSSVVNAVPLQQMPPSTSDAKNAIVDSIEFSHSDQRSQLPTIDKPSNDGYNWRKYGQKQVKGSEYPRSYYKCTHPNCPVKKKVERSLDGQVTEIIYKSEHNHQKPLLSRRAKEGGLLASGSPELNGNLDLVVKSEEGSQGYTGNMGRRNEIITAPSMSRRDQDLGHATHEQLSGSSDGEEVGDTDIRTDEGNDGKPDSKRRNIDNKITESVSSHRTVMEPRIIVQTTSEVDLLDDGYRWRKYGQKVVRGNPHPRSYYKCTNVGCNVRKHVERASTDPKAVITTYEGKHNHDVPAARHSSHNTANAAAANNVPPQKPPNSMPEKIASINRTEFRNNEQKTSVLLGWSREHDAA